MAGMGSTANALIDEFELGPDGEFEIILSAEPHEGNWLPLDESATMLVVRHFFYDWEHEVPVTMSIEVLSGPPDLEEHLPVEPKTAMARQVIALGDFLEENLNFFLGFSNPEAPNTFLPPLDGTAMGAAAENRPVIGSWKLAPDEALIIEVTPPEGLYWSYSLGNIWWETIDYGNRQSSLNGFQAAVDDDGKVRVVVAHQDPGVANWLDTAGHSEGPIILRCVRTETAPVPTTRVVSFDRLADELPAGHTTDFTERTGRRHRHPPESREQAVRPMSLDVDQIEQDARAQDRPGRHRRRLLPRGTGTPGGVDERGRRTDRDGRGHAADATEHVAGRPAGGRGDLPPPSRDRRPGHRRTGVRHRPAPYRHHRPQPAGGS